MNRVLNRSAFNYLLRHPLQLVLSLLGIALGVAVVVGIDLANAGASRAFELSMESVAGKSTHQITGGPKGLPDSVYSYLKIRKQINPMAPVVEGNVAIVRPALRAFTLLGVDPFSEKPFRSYLSPISGKITGDISAFMAKPGSIIISTRTAGQLGLRENDTLTLKIGGSYKKVKVLGLIEGENERSRNILDNLILSDISTAQELLNMPGYLSRIDLIIPDSPQGEEMLKKVKENIPPGSSVLRSETRTKIASDMLKAFDINLTALSLLALIVGMFLIYNTMTFSVLQRRTYIGLLRSIGVTQKEIFRIFLTEASILAAAGTILGILGGIVLAKGMLRLVTQTINDLYLVLSVRELNISLFSLAKGAFVGIGATLLAALKPSLEASSVPPRLALSRSDQEIKLRRKIPRLALMGIVMLLLGAGILSLPERSIILSYIGILPVILGFSLLTPLMILYSMKFISLVTGRLFGLTGRMASGSIVSQISRTAVAVAALSIAVSASVGIGTMVNSFRQTVLTWLNGNLEADIYISPPGLVLRNNDATMDSALVKRIEALPEVEDYNFYREITLNTGNDEMRIFALNVGPRSYNDFKFKEGNPEKFWSGFREGDVVMVTEPYAYRHNIKTGDLISIPTEKGNINFSVGGVYYDYASDLGMVTMAFDTYKKYWKEHSISGLSLFLKKGVKRDSLINYIRTMPGPDEEILVRSSNYLRKASIDVFDRSFMITNVLQVLAIVVAFIGILSSLMALLLERSREFAILRASGMTPLQLWKLLTIQTGLMGILAGVLSLPLGNVLAWILIYIINRRSFGWTMQYLVLPEVLIEALLVAISAALLAGIYPALKMARTSPALALREE
ncbi:MAG: FtsX-like permease family protein [Ignavibacteria bacterium]|jgi:putative ABC transport system permease protein|nr:FtsX-like permease family protein [Ignavibacteria bacterium]